MPTSANRAQMARKYGRLSFHQMQALLAKEETKDYLFVGFTDITSAVDTYGYGESPH